MSPEMESNLKINKVCIQKQDVIKFTFSRGAVRTEELIIQCIFSTADIPQNRHLSKGLFTRSDFKDPIFVGSENRTV